MSDFDRFFAEKLEEEGEFPHRDRNWRQLSKRLEAFEVGGGSHAPRWYYWAAAAVVAVSLTVAGWLVWKMEALKQENAALRQEVGALQQSAPAGQRAAELPATKLPEKSVLEKISKQEPPVAVHPATTVPAPIASAGQRSEKSAWSPAPEKAPRDIKSKPSAEKKDQVPAEDKRTPPTFIAPPIAVENEVDPTKSTVSPNTQRPDSLSTVASGNKSNPLSPIENNSTLASDSLQATALPPAQDSAQTVLAEKQREIVPPPTKLPDTVAQAAVPLIKPARSAARFRIGLEGVAGMPRPQQSGISLVTGTGIMASYSPLRSFRVMASADWVHYDVNTSQYIPKFHAPHGQPPNHPSGPYHELVQVESSQRQQHYALGLSYALPFHGWLRPAIQVAHTWVRVRPGLVIFRFEEHHGGGPGPGPGNHDSDYIAEKFAGQTISNIWRVGAGLEHELPRWTFGLWADYSKDFAATESTFDALMLRAGLQYKFD
ncbi:MAG: hypothetical protein ABIQ93_10330 [Saprospiraceae bacterium]